MSKQASNINTISLSQNALPVALGMCQYSQRLRAFRLRDSQILAAIINVTYVRGIGVLLQLSLNSCKLLTCTSIGPKLHPNSGWYFGKLLIVAISNAFIAVLQPPIIATPMNSL